MNDSIQKIMEDCSLPPDVYVDRLGISGGREDKAAAMCENLVGRTIAQMGRDGNIGRAYNAETNEWFRYGDKVVGKNGRTGTVIGNAIGEDGQRCLVIETEPKGGWRTFLMPVSEATIVKPPTVDEVHKALDDEMPAERLLKLVEAYVRGRS